MKHLILAALAAVVATGAWGADFESFAVPAMSNVKRMPDVRPVDAFEDGVVRIVVARDEFEPGSFVLKANRDLGKVPLTLTPLKTDRGQVFPAEDLDLKVIKVWYQNRNGWYSYFGDTGFALCPELLLNDEDLIRVDTEKEANYARLTEKDGRVHERWINPPRQMNRRYYNHHRETYTFQPMKADFRDAKTLQPVNLPKDGYRQFFLTVHAAKDAVPGIYRGGIGLETRDGRRERVGAIPVEIEVLPFELPAPRSYLEPTKDFFVSSYNYLRLGHIMEENGGDLELAKRQLEAILRDQVKHGQNMHWGLGDNADFDTIFGAMKKAGMRTDVISAGGVAARRLTPDELAAHAKRLRKFYDEKAPGAKVFLGFGDEPGQKWLMESRPVFDAYRREGFSFVIAGTDNVFHKAGYIYDWLNANTDPADGAKPALWNTIGAAHVAWYSTMHVGPENPAFNRRQNGMAAYLSNYSALCNYAHHLGPYNDDSTTYKPMVFAYGVYDGVLDTLQWEGFREGIDDIRYATLLVSLARAARDSGDRDRDYAGRRALHFLGAFAKDHDDLDYCRAEMIRHIGILRGLLGKEAK